MCLASYNHLFNATTCLIDHLNWSLSLSTHNNHVGVAQFSQFEIALSAFTIFCFQYANMYAGTGCSNTIYNMKYNKPCRLYP